MSDVISEVWNNTDSPPCLLHIGENRCTGCAACTNACPVQAIQLQLDPQGFYRPRRNPDLCDNCMACLEFCPVSAVEAGLQANQPPEPVEVSAAWSTSEEIHSASSSGGIFSELALDFLAQSGVVSGCRWDSDWGARHVLIQAPEALAPLRGSKYVPSFINPTLYRNIIRLARSGRPVLFCGTPCQVAGLAGLAPPSARSHLLLVDLVCHGVPSLKSFWSYLQWRFGERANVVEFTFRGKQISTQTLCATTRTGTRYMLTCAQDPWFRCALVYHLLLQRSCFACPFGGLPRSGDITLGDFWGIPEQWHHPRGDSMLMANSPKGKQMVRRLVEGGRIRIQSSDYATAAGKIHRLRGSIYPVPALRRPVLAWIGAGRSFGAIHRFCYQPLRLRERSSAAAGRRMRMLYMPLKQLWRGAAE
jgi:coenzyme F420-reducing hydrogenase beta subunit